MWSMFARCGVQQIERMPGPTTRAASNLNVCGFVASKLLFRAIVIRFLNVLAVDVKINQT